MVSDIYRGLAIWIYVLYIYYRYVFAQFTPMDVLIAQICLHHKVFLFTLDEHFDSVQGYECSNHIKFILIPPPKRDSYQLDFPVCVRLTAGK